MKSIDQIRNSLKSFEPSIGTWMQIPSAEIAEILSASSSYEWIVVDMEHGSFSREQLPSIIRAISLNSVLPFVRLQSNRPSAVKDIVDFGFNGYIVPMIEESTQLDEIYNAIMYPPHGRRGVGFSRSNQYGINFKKEVVSQQRPFLVAMIETKKALLNLGQILNYEFLDAVIVGPYDLSASLGICGNFESDIFKDAYLEIKRNCQDNNIPFGIHLIEPNSSKLKDLISEGARFIAFSMDSVMLYSSKPKV